MEMAAAAAMTSATFHPVCALSGVKASNPSTTFQRQVSVSHPARGIANVLGRIAERHAATMSSPQSNSVTRGSPEGEEHHADSGHLQESGSDFVSVQRREVMGRAAALMMSMLSLPAIAVEGDFTLYKDEEDKFAMLVPQEWSKGEGNAGTRKVTAFYPENDNSANVNVIITALGADYTALGSFGTVDIFAENLVNSLDRAWQRPKGQAAKLINARSRNGMYYIEYTIQKPGEAVKHLLSVVGIASNGWINRLYTATGQYWEDDSEKYKARLEKAIASFQFI